jgi:hypothetical protein
MKKIFFIIVLTLAFSVNTNAQENKVPKKDFTELAQKEAYELAEYLELNQTQAEDFSRLFKMKYDTLAENMSDERNTELIRIVDLKIRASLTAEQITKYDSNVELKSKLLSKEIK